METTQHGNLFVNRAIENKPVNPMARIGSQREHWTIDDCVRASEDGLDFINLAEKFRGSAAALGSITPSRTWES